MEGVNVIEKRMQPRPRPGLGRDFNRIWRKIQSVTKQKVLQPNKGHSIYVSFGALVKHKSCAILCFGWLIIMRQFLLNYLGILQTYTRTIISIITLQTTGEMEHKYENIRRGREKISSKIILFSFVDIWQMTRQENTKAAKIVIFGSI